MPIKPTLSFRDIKGNAGQVVGEWRWTLTQDYGDCTPFCGPDHGRRYSLVQVDDHWDIIAHDGLVWDYATGWWDYDGIKEGSLGHDILHWLIALGYIDTCYNDQIDKEFQMILQRRGGLHPWHARVLRRGTNSVDQEATGIDREVTHLLRGKRVRMLIRN